MNSQKILNHQNYFTSNEKKIPLSIYIESLSKEIMFGKKHVEDKVEQSNVRSKNLQT